MNVDDLSDLYSRETQAPYDAKTTNYLCFIYFRFMFHFDNKSVCVFCLPAGASIKLSIKYFHDGLLHWR